MKNWFVFYCDMYIDDCCLKEFNDLEKALVFIEEILHERVSHGDKQDLESITLIEGHKLTVEAIEVATKVQVKRNRH